MHLELELDLQPLNCRFADRRCADDHGRSFDHELLMLGELVAYTAHGLDVMRILGI